MLPWNLFWRFDENNKTPAVPSSELKPRTTHQQNPQTNSLHLCRRSRREGRTWLPANNRRGRRRRRAFSCKSSRFVKFSFLLLTLWMRSFMVGFCLELLYSLVPISPFLSPFLPITWWPGYLLCCWHSLSRYAITDRRETQSICNMLENYFCPINHSHPELPALSQVFRWGEDYYNH